MTSPLPAFIRSLLDTALPLFRNNVASEGGMMPVAYVGSTKEEKVAIVGMSFNTPSEKDQCANTVRRLAKETNADFIIFAAESWTVPPEFTEDYMKNQHKYKGVSTYPHRQEAVMISVETKDKVWSSICLISREKDGVKLTPPEFTEVNASQGRFSHLLGPRIV